MDDFTARQSFSENQEPSGLRDVNVAARRAVTFVVDDVVILALLEQLSLPNARPFSGGG